MRYGVFMPKNKLTNKPTNKPTMQKDHETTLRLWVTRALVFTIVLMSLLWGLTAEMYKKDLDRTLVRLKRLEKQIIILQTTIQKKP